MWYCREADCYVVTTGNLMMIDEHLHSGINQSIATDSGSFSHVGLLTCVSILSTCDKDTHTSHTHIQGHILPQWGKPSCTGGNPPILGHILPHWDTPSHTGLHPPTLIKGRTHTAQDASENGANSKTNLVQYTYVIIYNQIWLHIIVIRMSQTCT